MDGQRVWSSMGGCLGLFAEGKVIALQYDSWKKNAANPVGQLALPLVYLQEQDPRIHRALVSCAS